MLLRGAVLRIHRWRSCGLNAIDFVHIGSGVYSPEFAKTSEKSGFRA